MNYSGEQAKELVVRGLAAIGFVAVLLLGLWGTVQVVKLTPAVFSSLAAVTTTLTSVFVPQDEEITINTPDSLVLTNSVFELTWSHRGKPANARYTFSYACEERFSLEVSNEGGIYEMLSCDTPFSFTSEANALRLIPLLSEKRLVEVLVTVSSVDEENDTTASHTLPLTVANQFDSEESMQTAEGTQDSVLVPGEQTNEIFPVTDSRTTSDPNGEPDLTVRILGIGIINSESVFVPTQSVRIGDRGAIRFEISNIGTKKSDNWMFNAVLPTFPMHIFHSTSQQALAPGERIEFTLGFDQLNKNLSEGVVTINADPAYSIKELNEENNVRQTMFRIVQ